MAVLEPVVEFWTGWGLHFAVLLSFTVQVTLLLLADLRRRKDWAWLKIVIWSAYMLADTTAIYALGHMSVAFRWSPEHHGQLMALWAPLLLVHLGGQDNISAYAIEDNRLWLRHLQTFALQVTGAVYVLYLSSILSLPMSAPNKWAAILMLGVGVVKYGERIWALKRANSCAGSSLFARSYDNKQQVSSAAAPAAADSNLARASAKWDGHPIIVAYSLLNVPKQMFEGPTSYVQFNKLDNEVLNKLDDEVFNKLKKKMNKVHDDDVDGAKYMLRVVEIQLSMMYDLLYTKAAVVHTWYGLCSRVLVTLPFTVAALALHLYWSSLRHDDDKDAVAVATGGRYYKKSRSVDVLVTTVLLVGAVVLETVSVLRAIFSKWTAVLLYDRGWNIIGDVIFSVIDVLTRRKERLIASISDWSVHMRQHCLLKMRQPQQQRDGNSEKAVEEDQWDSNVYSWLGLVRMRQHSLFALTKHIDRSICSKMAKRLGLEDWWDSNVYSWSTEVPELVIQKVLELVADTTLTTDDIAISQGQALRRFYFDVHSLDLVGLTDAWAEGTLFMEVEELKLGEKILVWHIATHVYTSWCLNNTTPIWKVGEATEVLADYMFFLLAARPYMLPYPVSRQAYVQLCSHAGRHQWYDTRDVLLNYIQTHKEALKKETPLRHQWDEEIGAAAQPQPQPQPQPQHTMNATLDRGCQLAVAAKLIHIMEAIVDCDQDTVTKQRNGELVQNMVLDVWVEMLCHTAYLCNEKSHAKHLTDGGEIMTFITLLMLYIKNGHENTSGGTSSSQGAGATNIDTDPYGVV